MLPKAKHIAVFAMIYGQIFYILSCGPVSPNVMVHEYNQVMAQEQTATTRDQIVTKIAEAQAARRVSLDHSAKGKIATNQWTPEDKPTVEHLYSGSDIKPTVPSHANLHQALANYPDRSVPPFLAGFPFFCDPLNYAPNVILSASACRPFIRAIFPHLEKIYPSFPPNPGFGLFPGQY